MNDDVSYQEKKNMVEDYMDGITRDESARKRGRAGGTITNAVNEWIEEIGAHDAEAIRQFAVGARKRGVTVPDCVAGARINAILKRLGIVDDDAIYNFLGALVTVLADRIKPEKAAEIILDMAILSKQASVPIMKLPEYVQQLQDQMKQARDQFQKQKDQNQSDIEAMNQAKRNAEEGAKNAKMAEEKALKDMNITIARLDEYTRTKEELAKNGLSMEDPARAVPVLKNIKELQSAEKIINALKAVDSLQERIRILADKASKLEPTKIELARLQNQIEQLKMQRDNLVVEIGTMIDNGTKKMDEFKASVIASTAAVAGFKNAIESSKAGLIAPVSDMAEYLKSLKEQFDQSFKAQQDYIEKARAIGAFEVLPRAVRGEKVSKREYVAALIIALDPFEKICPDRGDSRVHAAHLHLHLKQDLMKMEA